MNISHKLPAGKDWRLDEMTVNPQPDGGYVISAQFCRISDGGRELMGRFRAAATLAHEVSTIADIILVAAAHNAHTFPDVHETEPDTIYPAEGEPDTIYPAEGEPDTIDPAEGEPITKIKPPAGATLLGGDRSPAEAQSEAQVAEQWRSAGLTDPGPGRAGEFAPIFSFGRSVGKTAAASPSEYQFAPMLEALKKWGATRKTDTTAARKAMLDAVKKWEAIREADTTETTAMPKGALDVGVEYGDLPADQVLGWFDSITAMPQSSLDVAEAKGRYSHEADAMPYLQQRGAVRNRDDKGEGFGLSKIPTTFGKRKESTNDE